jgi:hypothetical protein
MTRGLGTDFDNALSADELQPFFAVEMNFSSGILRLWGGYGDLTIDGNTYTGSADFLQISTIDETSEIRATGISVGLSGIPTSLIAIALTEDYQGRDITLYFGTLDSAGAINDTPYVVFKGRMDLMTMQEYADYCNITITGESRLIDLEIPRAYRYTSEDQKIDYPADKGLEFIADLQNKEIVWGS